MTEQKLPSSSHEEEPDTPGVHLEVEHQLGKVKLSLSERATFFLAPALLVWLLTSVLPWKPHQSPGSIPPLPTESTQPQRR